MKYELSPEETEAFVNKMDKFEAGLAREYGENELSLAKSLLRDLIASIVICSKAENVSPGKIARCVQRLINEISDHHDEYSKQRAKN